jgi:hypothetical protein
MPGELLGAKLAGAEPGDDACYAELVHVDS